MHIERLGPSSREALRDHYLRLCPEDRWLRFFGVIGERGIMAHCNEIDWSRAALFGLFADGALRGVVELIQGEGETAPELAISVEPAYRKAGVGHAMLETALAHARERGCEAIALAWLSENDRMGRIARDFGVETRIEDSVSYGRIPVRPPEFALAM